MHTLMSSLAEAFCPTYTVASVEDRKRLLAVARGCYQRALIRGEEAWSGATLRGVAKRYSGRYTRSGKNLLHRIQEASYVVQEVRQRIGGRRCVVMRDANRA